LSPKRHKALKPAKNLLDRDFNVITSILLGDGSYLAEEHRVVTLNRDGGGNGDWLLDIYDQPFSLHLNENTWQTFLAGNVGSGRDSDDD
jgi:hypothetical protein